MAEEKTEGAPKKISRREFIKKGAIIAGGVLAGAELAACERKKAPEYGTYVDKKYYTVKVEHGEEEYGHIRKEPHMQGEIKGEVPTQLGLTVNNVRKVWGSETGAAHGLTTFEDGQSRSWWYEGDWPSKENLEKKISGYVSSQFITEANSYDKPIE